LKEKRSHVRPILARLHKEFNLSVAEMGWMDARQTTEIACVMVCNDIKVLQSSLETVVAFIESHWPDCPIASQKREII
jgi:uncharacterized protein YlxP (DUF503 family)